MARDDLDYVSLVDFKPGIYSKYSLTVGTTLGKDGAARREHVVKTITDGVPVEPEYQNVARTAYAPLVEFDGYTWNHGVSVPAADGRVFLLFVGGTVAPSNATWTQGSGYWWATSLPPVVDFCGTSTYLTAHIVQIDHVDTGEGLTGEVPGSAVVEQVGEAQDGSIDLTAIDNTLDVVLSLAFTPATGFDLDPVTGVPGTQTTVTRQTVAVNPVTYGSGNTYNGTNYGGEGEVQDRGWVQHLVTFTTPTTPVTWTGGGVDAYVTAVAVQFVPATTATVTNETILSTYGCYGDPDGGLRPLPRLKERHRRDINTSGQNAFGAPDGEIGILDVGIVSPVLSYDFKAQANRYGAGANWFTIAQDAGQAPDQPDDLHILMYYTSSTATTGLHATNNKWAGKGGRPITEWRQYRLHERQTRGGMLQNLAPTTENPNNEVVLRRATDNVAPGELGGYGPGGKYTRTLKNTTERYDQWLGGGSLNNTTAGLYPSASLAVGRTTSKLTAGFLNAPERGNEPGKVVVVATSDHTHGWRAQPVVADDGTEALFPSLFGIYPDPLDQSTAAEYQNNQIVNVYAGSDGRAVFPRFRNKQVYSTNPTDFHQHRLDRYTALAGRFLVNHQDRFVGVLVATYARNLSSDYGAFQFLDTNEAIAYSEWNAVAQLTNNLLAPIVPDGTLPPNYLAPASGPNINKYRAWSFWKINERVTANPNDPYETNPGTPGGNAGTNTVIIRQDIYENATPSGVGTMASHGNDLLIVKNRGGAVLIRGAMEDAQVIPLPKVESTQHAIHHGVMTPLGYLYGSRNGAFLWNGGDTSERISAQLDGFFWDPDHYTGWDEARHNAVIGRFAYSYPFAYLPNGWVMDVRTGGWFRLNDPDEQYNTYKYMFYATNAFGDVYAVRSAFSNEPDCNYPIDVYSNRNGEAAQQFRWISQPLTRTINRTVMVEEAVLVAEGTGYVDVTVHGWEGGQTSHRFWIDSPDQPVRLVAALSLRASEITVQLDSVSARESTGPEVRVGNAPTVHAIHIGMRKSHEEPRNV